MAPRTLVARYSGTCRTCAAPIRRGETIVYAGRGLTFHQSCAAPGAEIVVTRFSSGAIVTRNARGICEDAPCCGCCTF